MSQPDEDDPLEQQQWLCELSLPLVFETYDEALEDNCEQPVVLLMDCGDEVGGRLARGWLGDEEVDEALAEFSHEGEMAIYARALPFKEAKRDIPAIFDYLAPAFETPPTDDGILVVSITAGGASVLTAPMDARPDPDAEYEEDAEYDEECEDDLEGEADDVADDDE